MRTRIAIVIAIAAVAAATASFAAAPKATQSSDDLAAYYTGSDYAERRAAADLAAYNLGSDFAERHPELSQNAESIDTTDYFLRHPELVPAREPALGVDGGLLGMLFSPPTVRTSPTQIPLGVDGGLIGLRLGSR